VSTPPIANSRPAQAASTASTPRTSAPTRIHVMVSPRNTVASRAVTTGFIEITTAPSTAGAPCSSAKYRQTNCSAWVSRPAIKTWPKVRPVGHVTRAANAQVDRMAPASPNRNTSTAIGDIAETASAPIG
jgi:hypothetical protein